MRKINHAALRYQVLSMLKESKQGLTPTELTEKLADFFQLTDDERKETYDRPNDKVFYKKVATDEQHLKAAELVDFQNGCHAITNRGLIAFSENRTNRTIEHDYLRKFTEYTTWETRLKNNVTNEEPTYIEPYNSFINKLDHNSVRFDILSFLSDNKSHSQAEIVEYLSDNYMLSQEEREERYENGNLKFYKTIAGIEQQLKRAGFETIENNKHNITEKGLSVLQNCPTNSISYKELKTPVSTTHLEKLSFRTDLQIDKDMLPHYANICEEKCTVFIVPRNKFDRKVDTDLMKYPCFYILTDFLNNDATCYIGYTGNPIERITTHKSQSRGIDFWNYALVFTFHDNLSGNHFDKCDVEYLEYLAIDYILNIGKSIYNSKGADEPYIKPAAKKEMDNAFEEIKHLASKVGLTLFEE